jgi:hypothetical protein
MFKMTTQWRMMITIQSELAEQHPTIQQTNFSVTFSKISPIKQKYRPLHNPTNALSISKESKPWRADAQRADGNMLQI